MIVPGDPKVFLRTVVDPACTLLTAFTGRPAMGSDAGRVLTLAIAIQETRLATRLQLDENGKALRKYGRGWWQFEAGGGVLGVMNHPASRVTAQAVCQLCFVPWAKGDIHEAIAWHDLLAPCFARLLLWTDPLPLPTPIEPDKAWLYYVRVWNPGKPRPEAWKASHQLAYETVTGR